MVTSHRRPVSVVIDLTASHIWDASTVAITTKYERKGKTVEIIGLNNQRQAPRTPQRATFDPLIHTPPSRATS